MMEIRECFLQEYLYFSQVAFLLTTGTNSPAVQVPDAQRACSPSLAFEKQTLEKKNNSAVLF